MMLVKVTSDTAVNPSRVSSVQVYPTYNTVVVKMVGGDEFTVPADYGRSVWQTHDRLVKAFNDAIMEKLNAVAQKNSPHEAAREEEDDEA